MYLMKKQKKVFSLPGTKPLFFTVIVVAPYNAFYLSASNLSSIVTTRKPLSTTFTI